jgi:iron(III) transport system ATP-binding protein
MAPLTERAADPTSGTLGAGSDRPAPMLEIHNLRKTFSEHRGAAVKALDGVSISVPEGKLFTILGESGSGKTTMLRSIAGLERPDSGRIDIGGTTMFDGGGAKFVPPNKRGLGMVFQSYAIWPHMTVFQNVAFPLKARRTMKRAQIRSAVGAALETMQMSHLADRPATHLSGGQQQRLALARAIVGNPRLLLLDEPLSNLDAKLRERMRFELKRLQRETGITTIYVTHDQAEALALSDEIALMHDGRVLQQGTPAEIYYRPSAEYVADFIGSTNLLSGILTRLAAPAEPCSVELDGVVCRGILNDVAAVGDVVALAVRPESVGITRSVADPAEDNVLGGVVLGRVFLGESTEFLVKVGPLELRVRTSGLAPEIEVDDRVALTLPTEECLVFRRDGAPAAPVAELGAPVALADP